MYRLLPCVSDAYVTNKIIRQAGGALSASRSIDANTGQASSLDFYKLYDETLVVSGGTVLSGTVELTRGVVKFDLSPLRALTASFFNPNSSFKAYLRLRDGYSGQTTPSNFVMEVHPLAKAFSEGRGIDVIGYRDKDAVNWTTSSVVNGTPTLWQSGGCGYGGVVGDAAADYYTSGTFGTATTSSFRVTQSFPRGDEDLLVDVTALVSASVVGVIPDNGFRVAFTTEQETDDTTRFVKRFTSRHTRNWLKHPTLLIHYSGDLIQDTQGLCWFDTATTINTYNTYGGEYHNFVSGATPITGSNSLQLVLVASKSILYTTNSFSITHSQSISHITSSFQYVSYSIPASQLSLGGVAQTGVYTATTTLNYSDAGVQNYVTGGTSLKFVPLWKSLDGTVLYASGACAITFTKPPAGGSNVAERNFIVSMPNLKTEYASIEVSRLRVFIQDYNTQITPLYLPAPSKSKIYQNVWWRLIHSTTKEVVVPFERTTNSTKLSTDGHGQWFDMYMEDLEPNQPLEFEFLIRENGQDYMVGNQGFVFKVRSDV